MNQIAPNFYTDYLGGDCITVWEKISFIDFVNITGQEREILDSIILETLHRIDYNIKVVFDVIVENGFNYKNYGMLNSFGVSYSLKSTASYKNSILSFYKNGEQLKVPLFFAAFCSFFNVVDFRGEFYRFDVGSLLDELFIESFKNRDELDDLVFEQVFDDEVVKCCMFSPDDYTKSDSSGSLGPCILLTNNYTVDNYVVNYTSQLKLTFLAYLRFCFYWSCFPNLYWAPESEKTKFKSILDEVRVRLKPF